MAGTLTDPIQSFSITENVQFYENGKAKLYLFNISVAAKITPSQELTIEERHNIIIARQAEILAQFQEYSSASPLYFEVQPRDKSQPFKFIPRVQSISFKEGAWVEFCDYTIEMEADEIYIGSVKVPVDKVSQSDIDESWTTEYNQEDLRLTKVNHKISAKSKSLNGVPGWQISKTNVFDKIDALIPSDIQGASLATYNNPCNKLTSYSVNSNTGEFSAEINIVYHDSAIFASVSEQNSYAFHEQTVTDKINSENIRDELSIEGTISGLNAITDGDRYTAANNLWESVKSHLDGVYSNLTILSSSCSKDLAKGIINYNYQIQNIAKPSGDFKSESASVTFFGPKANPLKNYIIHNTISGKLGPIFQYIDTNKARTMSITIERVGSDVKPDTIQYKPAGSVIESDSINFTAQNKKISRTTTFMWADGLKIDPPTIDGFDIIKTPIPRPY